MIQDYLILAKYLTGEQLQELLESWQAEGYDEHTTEVKQIKLALKEVEL